MAEESEKLEETHNGIRKKGDLEDIKEFSDDVKQAVDTAGVQDASVEEFDEWRPQEDDVEQDIKEKTVKSATKTEKQLEKQSDGVKQDVAEASDEIFQAGEKAKRRESPDKELKNASKKAVTPLVSGAAKTVRKIEQKIYSKLMIPLNGYYFDSEGLAADVKSLGNKNYVMDVKIPEKDKRDQVQDEVKERD